MNNAELTDSFLEFKELKNIDKQTMQHVLEDVFRSMFKKKFNTDKHIDIIVNIDKGDVQIFLNKEIVDDGEVEDPNTEIAYSDAIKIEPDFEIGEEVTEEFKFADFGRRNILANPYFSTPILITVEGSNIMTRSLIQFGQGAIMWHPHAYKEILALEQNDINAFDEEFFSCIWN